MPQTFIDVVELLIPELQRRGIFWEDYHTPGGTYRENLYGKRGQTEPKPSHPAGKLIWRPSKKSVGFAAHGTKPDINGQMDYTKTLEDEDTIDPAAMQLA